MVSDVTQVLTFALRDAEYCVPIDCVAEIVESGEVRSVPNTDPHVEGVTDLRGKTTTVIDPTKVLSNVSGEGLLDDGSETRIVVLDSESIGVESPTAWVVSDVREVIKVRDEDVDSVYASDDELLEGVVKTDGDGFTMWVNAEADALTT